MAERNPTPGATPARPLADRVAEFDAAFAASQREEGARAMMELAQAPPPEMTATGQRMLNEARMLEYRMTLEQIRMQMEQNINRAYYPGPTFRGVTTNGAPLAPRHCNIVERDGRWIGMYLGHPIPNMPTSLSSSEREALDRGLDHFATQWTYAVDHLRAAGLEGEELRAPMTVLQVRLATAADAEMKRIESTLAADRKAKALLVMCLNNAQRQDFEKHERFAIEVQHDMKEFPTGQFQISKAASFNVMHVETQERFCVTAVDCPIYDQMLTQKLLLEQDPETFFKTANRDGVYGGPGRFFRVYNDAATLRPNLGEVLRRYEMHQLREATMARARANRGDTILFRRPLPYNLGP